MILSCNILFIYQIIITFALHFFSLIKHSKNFLKKKKLRKYLAEFLFITDKAGMLSV